MNDTEILDQVIYIFEEGEWYDKKNTMSTVPFGIFGERKEGWPKYNYQRDHGKYFTAVIKKWREEEQAQQNIDERIRLEVAKQIKKLKPNQH